ncbi:DUF1501 domain-containing protein [Xylophilus rhododendri]|uniref:DUF1501 domain-containing protein n=1 Tax=Xylophilus rhododendri TaxID=2697032 RepID=A0A857IYC4_9BURK|nr:DUF1501 domain-containing protein [Xylophilus rhododendri]QHI96550.1 DUF1501 domain-containing protein [Xylophilus rhododendri]
MNEFPFHNACPDAYPDPDRKIASPARRAFLRRSSQLTLTGTALPFALNLAAMGEAAAFEANDYKALVCVFLNGGNDYANTVVTYDDPSYNAYATIRGGTGQAGGGCALAKSALAPTLLNPTAPLPDGRQYALNPAMGALALLFNSGKAAVQLNVGPLVVPLTRAQFEGADRHSYPLPARLMSHSDQQSVWMSSGGEGTTVGWGGRIGDLALASNGSSVFTCISATGNAVFLSGQQAIPYQVSTGGAVALNAVKSNVYGSTAIRTAMSTLLQESSTHALENDYNRVTARSVASEAQVTSALAGATLSTAFPTTTLGSQLKIVARMIAARNSLNVRRQVFFVSMGGFDLHDNLMSQHPTVLAALSDAMAAFHQATVEMGISSQVTAFTASDFGRTLAVNGTGADHGWGSHHFMVGGAVKGQAFYGTAPPVSIGNTTATSDQWHIGQGRLLPSTSVDQYAATLARWFGVADAELDGILPNLRNFGTGAGRGDYPRDLGFMRT